MKNTKIDGFSMRRQGIFWLCTLSCESVPCLPMLREGELPSTVVWIKGQKERGNEGGYLHWQFVCAFSKKVSLRGLKSLFGSAIHGELSRSDAAAEYCCKEDTRVDGPWEWGAKPIQRNAKLDWDSIWTSAVSGDLLAIPASIRISSYRALRSIASDYAVCSAMEREVYVFWGRTGKFELIIGSGKSRRAWDEAGLDAYSKDPRSKFWDGYQGSRNVVIDEFRGGIDVAHILRWCDRYPVRVEVKGSSAPLCAKRIWFTSNVDPRDWYPDLDEETKAALLRRFNIIHFN